MQNTIVEQLSMSATPLKTPNIKSNSDKLESYPFTITDKSKQ